MLIVDTGVLLAAADNADADHDACARLLQDDPGPLVTTALVIAETAYLIGRQLGAHDEARFFRSNADGDLHVETQRHFSVVRPVHTDAFELIP